MAKSKPKLSVVTPLKPARPAAAVDLARGLIESAKREPAVFSPEARAFLQELMDHNDKQTSFRDKVGWMRLREPLAKIMGYSIGNQTFAIMVRRTFGRSWDASK